MRKALNSYYRRAILRRVVWAVGYTLVVLSTAFAMVALPVYLT